LEGLGGGGGGGGRGVLRGWAVLQGAVNPRPKALIPKHSRLSYQLLGKPPT